MIGSELQEWVVVVVGTTVGQVMTGASVSFTVTRNEQVLVSPTASVARHTTVVRPFGKFEPLPAPAGLCSIVVTPGQLSDAVGEVYVTAAWHWPASVPFVMLDGQLMLGSWLSFTVMVKEQVAVLGVGVAASAAFHTTVVCPFGKTEPLAVLDALCSVTVVVPQLSVAVGLV